jgi:hypothetical protein
VQNRKEGVTGNGNNTMKLAHKLIVSKRGLTIVEKGEKSDNETLLKYKDAFEEPLSLSRWRPSPPSPKYPAGRSTPRVHRGLYSWCSQPSKLAPPPRHVSI